MTVYQWTCLQMTDAHCAPDSTKEQLSPIENIARLIRNQILFGVTMQDILLSHVLNGLSTP